MYRHGRRSDFLRNNAFLMVCFVVVLSPIVSQSLVYGKEFVSEWPGDVERTWVGPEYWANRLQDWRISKGRLECLEGRAGKPMRTVHLLTRRLTEGSGELDMGVRTGLLGKELSPQAAVGFLIGAGPDLDYRAAALVHHSVGKGAGIFAGIDGDGFLFIRDLEKPGSPNLVQSIHPIDSLQEIVLRLSAKRSNGMMTLILAVGSFEGENSVGSVVLKDVEPERITGSMALVSHPGKRSERFWFSDWTVSGSKVKTEDDRTCGPIISAQHTLSRGVMKMTAQLMPIGMADNQTVELQVVRENIWETVAKADVVVPGWTATFRVEDWKSNISTSYRLIYELKRHDGETDKCVWSGKVHREPANQKEVVIAAFTGNHNVRHPGVDRGNYTWTPNWMWFPHQDIVEHVLDHKPDLLFFSGDQVYEGASPTAADRSGRPSSYLDYMYKWYLWCWAYRDLTKDIPCVCIPDDHDIFQGNLWGAAGRKTTKDDEGGYVMPAEFVRMVERTQCSNLPDPYDPTPVGQNIGVYYTRMDYGWVSFAILEDRKFKSGCSGLAPPTTSGRADHVLDPEFDPKTADVPGAKLLGDRQMEFLGDWATDWQGVEMKIALSQTGFANVATHHGAGLQRLVADYDSNGWPQTGRNKALDALRRCFAFHIGGDQHLSTIVQHGIDDWGDAGWSFVVPSIANFYPRAWKPSQPGMNRQEEMPEYTGEFLDGFGNHITVYAATNPDKSMDQEPAALHDKMPGYGIVILNKKTRTITMECWPRYVDPRKNKDGQYDGWPKTIQQEDNYGRKAVAYLPTIKVSGMKNPVIQVIDQQNDEIVYTLRIEGKLWRPKVFRAGMYTIKIGEPGTDDMQVLTDVEAGLLEDDEEIEVHF